ncbi:MAG TPA: hypothetical protein VIL95_08100 [Bacillota bacterium]
MARDSRTIASMIVAIALLSALSDGLEVQSLLPLLFILAVVGGELQPTG